MRNGAAVMVIIPALDEEIALPGVLKRIPSWVDCIIVVDNGSQDNTADVARTGGATVVNEPIHGYGRACLAGITAIEGAADIIVFLDADGSDFPEQIVRLVDPISTGVADLVIGSRTLGTMDTGAMSPPQRLGNAIAPALIRLLWGERFTDLGPFRAVRAASLYQMRMDDQTYGWTVQMQIRAARFGLRSLEAPVDYARRKGGRSKISGTIRGVVKAGVKILSCVATEYVAPAHSAPRTLEKLAVFTKFPEAGCVKTRLIPALGAQGAAELHSQMVQHTLEHVMELGRMRKVEAHVRCAGATPDEFTSQFGAMLPYESQSAGDLGARMHDAFGIMLRSASTAVIIGTDCPELNASLLDRAFDSLRTNDVVLGPAFDGGYYLIGLRRPIPHLFQDISWSSEHVLAETLCRASLLGLNVHLLPELSDVDEPKDLPIWDAVRNNSMKSVLAGARPDLSIIIPTLNEAATIAKTLDAVRRPGVEIIVADGGSDDDTRDISAAHGARVVVAPRGRGPQLNAGAARARSQHLLFLHADTHLPCDYPILVARTLDEPAVAIGAFRFKLDQPNGRLRVVEHAVHLRCSLFKTAYGDQAYFLRADTFHALGGFADIPLLEDVDIIRRARSLGRIQILREPAVTSSRRWTRAGVVRMTVINQICLIAYALGVAPHRLAEWRSRWSSNHGLNARRNQRPAESPRASGSQADTLALESIVD